MHTALAFAKYGIEKLALSDVNIEELNKALEEHQEQFKNVEILKLHIDVRKEGDIESGIRQTIEKFGRLDIAVNNAGIRGPIDNTHTVSEDDWADLIDVNLSGVWRCQKAELRVMKNQEDKGTRQGRGRIINIASMFGLSAPPNGLPHTAYTSAKHGKYRHSASRWLGMTNKKQVLLASQRLML